jgi:hypothetical protein
MKYLLCTRFARKNCLQNTFVLAAGALQEDVEVDAVLPR